jgi:hypothetical protein
MIAEFSGNTEQTTSFDTQGTNSNTAASFNLNANGADQQPYELVTWSYGWFYSAASAASLTSTLNNGITVNEFNNNGVSTQFHYNFGWGIVSNYAHLRNQNAVATSDSINITVGVGSIVSWLLPPFQTAPTRAMPSGV